MRAISIDLQSYGFKIHKFDTGEVVRHQAAAPRNELAPAFNGHRGELHEIVFRYAESLGINIHLGRKIVRYFEDSEGAGVEFEKRGVDGEAGKEGEIEVVRGDVVVGADGVRSKARTLVLGYEDKPKSSGYAVWRAWYIFDSTAFLSSHLLIGSGIRTKTCSSIPLLHPFAPMAILSMAG
jgi:2-polyprenyl-6-methoxyphenol hydroxylase-like FAD-dependent oxidoreductase